MIIQIWNSTESEIVNEAELSFLSFCCSFKLEIQSRLSKLCSRKVTDKYQRPKFARFHFNDLRAKPDVNNLYKVQNASVASLKNMSKASKAYCS